MDVGWQKPKTGNSQWGGGVQETKNRTFRRRRWGVAGGRKESHKGPGSCRRGMRRVAGEERVLESTLEDRI